MLDEKKSKNQLIKELQNLRKKAEDLKSLTKDYKLTKQTLNNSLTKYKNLIENVNIGVYRNTLGPSGRFLQANPTIVKLMGYDSHEEFMKIHVSDCYQKASDRKRYVNALLKEGFIKDHELKLKKKNGSPFWASCTSKIHYDESGKPLWSDGVIEDITERKTAEQKINRSYQMTRDILEKSPFGIFVANKKGNIEYVNPAMIEISGDAYSEFMNINVFSLSTYKKVGLATKIKTALNGRGFVMNEVEHTNHLSGKETIRNIIGTPLKEDGEPKVLIFVENITERKKIERAIDQTRHQQQAILDNITDMAWLKDKEGRFIAVNQPFIKSCGVPSEDLVGKTDLYIWPRKLALNYRADDREVIRTKKRNIIEEPLINTDGKTIWIETIKTPVFNDKMEVIGTTGLARDISERKKVDEEIRKFKTISDIANYGVAIASLDGTLNYTNDYFAKVHGYTTKELQGRNLSLFHNEEQISNVLEINRKLKKTGYYTNQETWHVHRNGSVFPMLMNGMLLKHEKGKPGFIAATAIDITQIKETEKALRRSKDELESMVDKRTSELQNVNEQLRLEISERKLTQEALQESEERYRSLVESARDIIFIINPEMHVQYVNDFGAEQLGLRPMDILAKSLDELFPIEVYNRQQRHLKRIFKTGKHFSFEGKTKFSEKELWLHTQLVPIHGESGKVRAIMGISRDITIRKKAEEALKNSEEKYRNLFEESRDAICLTSRSGIVIDINQSGLLLFDYSRNEMIGMNAQELYSETSARKIFQKNVEQKGSLVEYEVLMKKSNGIVMTCLLTSTVSRSADNAIIGYQTIIRDITRRKISEKAIRESEALYRGLVETSPDAIILTDLETHILVANQEAANMNGSSSPEDLTGKMAIDFIIKEDHARLRRNLKRTFSRGFLKDEEYTYLKTDGSTLIGSTSASVVADAKEQPYALIVVIRDVTERRRNEEQIHIKNEELTEALSIKTQFLSMMSHELRTPLTLILGYAEMILKERLGPVSEDLSRPLQVIYRRARGLHRLIEDLLQISSLDRGSLKIQIQPMPIEKHLNEIIADFMNMDFGKALSMKWEGEIFSILADHTRFHQIIENLVNNTIKYSYDSVDLTFSTKIDKGKGYISVIDTGMGIGKEHLSHIFDRFYQADQDTTKYYGGAGLGLSISRELIELMNGEIIVESKLGIGSTFTVSFPLARQKQNLEKEPGSIESNLSTILVIDNAKQTLELIIKTFQGVYEVHTAANTKTGLQQLKKASYNLILLKWSTTGCMRFIEEINKNEVFSNIPIILMSMKENLQAIQQAIDTGAKDFILKPLNEHDLYNKIQQWTQVR
ncbi:MAG: PAS domain S-box protein [Candidatus Theseobacter exili]|nr:PAS domain S-box protein [Candidatus Theseobacter exili]